MNRRTTTAFAGASVLLDRGIRDQLRLGWRLLRDERVPALKFALPALLGLYVVSPLDPIPDFLLGLGQIDGPYPVEDVHRLGRTPDELGRQIRRGSDARARPADG